jgi:hypothetical protein
VRRGDAKTPGFSGPFETGGAVAAGRGVGLRLLAATDRSADAKDGCRPVS